MTCTKYVDKPVGCTCNMYMYDHVHVIDMVIGRRDAFCRNANTATHLEAPHLGPVPRPQSIPALSPV